MTAFVLQSITPAGEEKIKERYRLEYTKAINEDDIIGMVKLIITCHTSTGKASEFTDKLKITEISLIRRVQPSRSLYLLDRKVLQVGATRLPTRDQVNMVIMKLKEHKS